MSTKHLKLKIVTPERLILEEEVDSVTLPTVEGEITVLPEHISLISALKAGEIIARKGEEIIPMAVAGGFIEIKPYSAEASKGGLATEVAVLADFAEHVSEISDEVIAKAKARADELMKMKDDKEVVDFEHFEAELERSLTMVKVGSNWKNKKYRR